MFGAGVAGGVPLPAQKLSQQPGAKLCLAGTAARSRSGRGVCSARGVPGESCTLGGEIITPHVKRLHASISKEGCELCWMLPPRSPCPQVLKGRRDGMPPHLCSMAQRAYGALLTQRQDQAILPLGRSGAGRTACCQGALEYLVGTAGSLDGTVSGMGPVGRRPPGLRVPFGSRSLQICYFDKPQSKQREGMTCPLWAALLPCDQVTDEVRGSGQLESSSGLRGPGGLRARHAPAKGWHSPSCRHKSCHGAGRVVVCAGGAGGAASRRSCPRRMLSGWCWVSVEKIQAMFTVLGAFGSVTTSHSSSSTRFSMVLSLDFSATGRITAAHLQVPAGPAASSRDGDRAGAVLGTGAGGCC